MTIKTEKSLWSFDFWSGAKDNADLLTYDELDQLEEILESEEQEWTETEINDLMWFEFDTICEWLGLELNEDGELERV